MGVYKWKEGARFSADVDLVAAELNSLPQKTPEAALNYAEDETTELHKCATWDDAKAAHLYRLEEMRSVIRSVVVVDESADDEKLEYRAFEYVVIQSEDEKEKSERQFMPTSEILSDKDYRKQILGQIKRSIAELSAKAKTYRYLAEKELDAVQKHLQAAHQAVSK